MIKVYDRVPEYYYKESRDFQLLGRIFEAVFNHTKTAADTLLNNPLSKNSDESLMDLVTKTIGFESRHNYDIPNLVALANSFKSILKIKGTKQSIEDCVRVLLNAQNIHERFDVIITTTKKDGAQSVPERLVTIYVPENIRDIHLLEDMLDYVLPAGFNYSIIIASISPATLNIEASSFDEVTVSPDIPDKDLGVITPGVVTLDKNELENIYEEEGTGKGVLDNTVIIKPTNN